MSLQTFYAMLASVGVVKEPKDFKNAVESPQADHWKNAMEEEMDSLVKQFEMTSSPADCFVGIQIARDRVKKTIHISQENYIKRLLEKFGLSDCKTRVVPADPFSRLSKGFDRRDMSTCPTLMEPFREAVRSLIDADFASNLDDRCSTTGIILMLNGGPVSWKSQRKKCVSLSTTESEYVAAATASKEIVWIRRLLQDFCLQKSTQTTRFCDNESSIKLVKNAEFHQRTAHIDLKFHFIRTLQEGRVIDATYINTDMQLADILTKAFDRTKICKAERRDQYCYLYLLIYWLCLLTSLPMLEWVCSK